MRQFTVKLPTDGFLTGRLFFPMHRNSTYNHVPLIVCIHGASYDAEYFDIDDQHSIFTICEALDVPVIAFDRPGYGGSTACPDPAVQLDSNKVLKSFAQVQGQYFHTTVLPFLWRNFASESGASSMVLLAHSVGAMMAVVAAASAAQTQSPPEYPLSGLIISGIGERSVLASHAAKPEVSRNDSVSIGRDGEAKGAVAAKSHINFDLANKNRQMLNVFEKTEDEKQKLLIDPVVLTYTKRLNRPVPVGELHDVRFDWRNYWRSYAAQIKVPLLYGLAEFDGFWDSSDAEMTQFIDAFTSSERVEKVMIPMAPHCIELSYQAKGWLIRCSGFAIGCAVARGLAD